MCVLKSSVAACRTIYVYFFMQTMFDFPGELFSDMLFVIYISGRWLCLLMCVLEGGR